VLELVPGAPRVQRLHGVLKGCEYDEGHERDEDEEEEQGEEDRTVREALVPSRSCVIAAQRKRARYTREKMRGEVQASDAELGKAMVNYRILEIDGGSPRATKDHHLVSSRTPAPDRPHIPDAHSGDVAQCADIPTVPTPA
jgi:sister chromatid cohesion protein DCC1